ncbi:MAG: flagellar hook-basal body complex protein FliE [Calditrichia bacterium]
MIRKIQAEHLPKEIRGDVKDLSQKDAEQFKATLKGFIEDVNEMQGEAKETAEAFVRGEITDLHQVTIATQKARVSLELLLEIRNKVLESYQEIMRMQL